MIVEMQTVGVGVSHQVKPVSPEVLAKLGRCEQSVDKSLVSIRGIVGQERCSIGVAGGKPGQVEANATKYRSF